VLCEKECALKCCSSARHSTSSSASTKLRSWSCACSGESGAFLKVKLSATFFRVVWNIVFLVIECKWWVVWFLQGPRDKTEICWKGSFQGNIYNKTFSVTLLPCESYTHYHIKPYQSACMSVWHTTHGASPETTFVPCSFYSLGCEENMVHLFERVTLHWQGWQLWWTWAE
jgi:hypothetical protein